LAGRFAGWQAPEPDVQPAPETASVQVVILQRAIARETDAIHGDEGNPVLVAVPTDSIDFFSADRPSGRGDDAATLSGDSGVTAEGWESP
jgi:hypothetical protein